MSASIEIHQTDDGWIVFIKDADDVTVTTAGSKITVEASAEPSTGTPLDVALGG